MKRCSGCGKLFDDEYEVCPVCGQICPAAEVIDLTNVYKKYTPGKKKKRIISLIIISVVLLFAILFFVIIHTGMKRQSADIVTDDMGIVKSESMVTVPDMTGMTVEEAYAVAKGKILYIEIAGREYSDKIKDGRIVCQSVDSGEKVEAGTVISLMVSLGEKYEEDILGDDLIKVPDVSYMKGEEAVRLLEEEGFAVITGYEFSDIVSEGYVIRQDLQAGLIYNKGYKITITVSGIGKE